MCWWIHFSNVSWMSFFSVRIVWMYHAFCSWKEVHLEKKSWEYPEPAKQRCNWRRRCSIVGSSVKPFLVFRFMHEFFSMICSALFDLNVIWSELKMEWLWLSLLSSKNFHLLLLSSRWTHLQLYIHAIERCIIANMLQQYENIKRYIFKNNGYSRMKKLCYFWKAYVILRLRAWCDSETERVWLKYNNW